MRADKPLVLRWLLLYFVSTATWASVEVEGIAVVTHVRGKLDIVRYYVPDFVEYHLHSMLCKKALRGHPWRPTCPKHPRGLLDKT